MHASVDNSGPGAERADWRVWDSLLTVVAIAAVLALALLCLFVAKPRTGARLDAFARWLRQLPVVFDAGDSRRVDSPLFPPHERAPAPLRERDDHRPSRERGGQRLEAEHHSPESAGARRSAPRRPAPERSARPDAGVAAALPVAATTAAAASAPSQRGRQDFRPSHRGRYDQDLPSPHQGAEYARPPRRAFYPALTPSPPREWASLPPASSVRHIALLQRQQRQPPLPQSSPERHDDPFETPERRQAADETPDRAPTVSRTHGARVKMAAAARIDREEEEEEVEEELEDDDEPFAGEVRERRRVAAVAKNGKKKKKKKKQGVAGANRKSEKAKRNEKKETRTRRVYKEKADEAGEDRSSPDERGNVAGEEEEEVSGEERERHARAMNALHAVAGAAAVTWLPPALIPQADAPWGVATRAVARALLPDSAVAAVYPILDAAQSHHAARPALTHQSHPQDPRTRGAPQEPRTRGAPQEPRARGTPQEREEVRKGVEGEEEKRKRKTKKKPSNEREAPPPRIRLSDKARHALFEAQDGRCAICLKKIPTAERAAAAGKAGEARRVIVGDVDHKRPRWAGGPDALANLQFLCTACHRLKTVITDREWLDGGATPDHAWRDAAAAATPALSVGVGDR